MAKLKDGLNPAGVESLHEKFRRLSYPGMLSFSVGSDLGLREGNWSMAIVADFATEADYRVYDEDPEHNRLRAELAPMVDEIARVQFTC
jgi:Stress responsive A/B Barrel Domain